LPIGKESQGRAYPALTGGIAQIRELQEVVLPLRNWLKKDAFFVAESAQGNRF